MKYPTPTECREALKNVFDYLDGCTDSHDNRHIRRHLDMCRHCYSRFEFEKKLIARIRKTCCEKCPERLRKRIKDIVGKF